MKKIAIVSEKASALTLDTIDLLGYEVIKIPSNPNTYEAISHHPDINCFVTPNRVVLAEYCYKQLKNDFERLNFEVICGGKLGMKYPQNIGLNGLLLDKTFVHKLEDTDNQLLKLMDRYKQININQGYSKCSCVLVDDQALITSDKGIYEALKGDFYCLLVSPQQVTLEGFDYGFIGGASGHSESFVFFNGNVESHSDYEAIECFIRSRGKYIVQIKDQPLVDLGSFLFLER